MPTIIINSWCSVQTVYNTEIWTETNMVEHLKLLTLYNGNIYNFKTLYLRILFGKVILPI